VNNANQEPVKDKLVLEVSEISLSSLESEEKIFMGEYVVMKLTENLWGKIDELEKNL
jgi:hypothetical protein